MKKVISLGTLLLVAAAIFATSCAKQNVIKGSLREAVEDTTYVYLYDIAKSETPIDSVAIAKGKDFELPYTPVEEGKALYVLELPKLPTDGERIVYFVPEQGVITVDTANLQPHGTPLNDAIAKFNESIIAIEKGDPSVVREKMFEACKAFFMEHKELPVSLIAFEMSRQVAAKPTDIKQLVEAGGKALESYESFSNAKKMLLSLEKTQPGKMFTDFEGVTLEGNDAKGKPVKLSDYLGKGQYVVVDFWASWCRPCRVEITETLKPLYDKYRNKGLSIIGVTVGDKKEDHLKAVKSMGITWPQIYDEKSVGADLYGISSIPQIMLVGPDGVIIARDLYGEAVKEAVAPLYK